MLVCHWLKWEPHGYCCERRWHIPICRRRQGNTNGGPLSNFNQMRVTSWIDTTSPFNGLCIACHHRQQHNRKRKQKSLHGKYGWLLVAEWHFYYCLSNLIFSCLYYWTKNEEWTSIVYYGSDFVPGSEVHVPSKKSDIHVWYPSLNREFRLQLLLAT